MYWTKRNILLYLYIFHILRFAAENWISRDLFRSKWVIDKWIKDNFPNPIKQSPALTFPKLIKMMSNMWGFAGILSNCETTDNTIRLFKREFKYKSKLNQVTSKFALIKSMSNMQKHNWRLGSKQNQDNVCMSLILIQRKKTQNQKLTRKREKSGLLNFWLLYLVHLLNVVKELRDRCVELLDVAGCEKE